VHQIAIAERGPRHISETGFGSDATPSAVAKLQRELKLIGSGFSLKFCAWAGHEAIDRVSRDRPGPRVLDEWANDR
jgi:hypothetical protein